jgi:hypothetical protein
MEKGQNILQLWYFNKIHKSIITACMSLEYFPYDEVPTVDRSTESAALLQRLSSPANPQEHSDNHTPAATFELFTLPIQCAYFTYSSPINSDYFPTKHSKTGVYTRQEVRTLQYGKTNVTVVFISCAACPMSKPN